MNWNGPLRQINDFRFEIPSNYQGEQKNLHMKTSGVIYANNGMIECIRMDNAPEKAYEGTDVARAQVPNHEGADQAALGIDLAQKI